MTPGTAEIPRMANPSGFRYHCVSFLHAVRKAALTFHTKARKARPLVLAFFARERPPTRRADRNPVIAEGSQSQGFGISPPHRTPTDKVFCFFSSKKEARRSWYEGKARASFVGTEQKTLYNSMRKCEKFNRRGILAGRGNDPGVRQACACDANHSKTEFGTMNDETKQHSLSPEEFARFFDGVASAPTPRACLICGNQQSAVNAGESGEVASLILNLHNNNGVQIGRGHIFYSCSCTKCGNSMFFHKTMVDQWLTDNPSPATEPA